MKLKIAVIDDEPSIRDTFQWLLEDLGHDVLAFDVPEHCEVFIAERCNKPDPCCDAILIDYHMPGLNGLEFLEKMIEGGCLLDTANVVLMSGDTTKIEMEKVERLGCSVVQKPLTLDFLEGWLQQVIARNQSR